MKRILVLLGLSLVVGCASPADMNSMIVGKSPTERLSLPDVAKGAFTVTKVGGGEETNPLWTSEVDNASFRGALVRSLDDSGLGGGLNTAKHEVEANLVSMDQPLFGLDFTVTSTVNYIVRNAKTKAVWMDERINASYTATVGDAFIAITRLKLANEGAIRENLRIFIDEVVKRMPTG